MSRRSPILTLRGWLLVVLLPVLGLVNVGYAVLVYDHLHAFIIAGFDAKLTAISTTTAAFLDPAEHARLVEPLPLGSVTHDPGETTLWALDLSEHRFLRVRESDGLAEETTIAVPPEINNTTNGLASGEIYLVDNQAGHFLRYLTAARHITPAFDVPPPIYALATSQGTHSVYVAGRTLRRIDLLTGKIEERGPLSEKIRDLTCNRNDGDALYALGQYGDELLRIDPKNGAILRRTKLILENTDPADTGPPQPAEIQNIVWDPGNNRLFGVATSLVRIDPITGVVSAKGFLPGFGQEQGAIYRRYVEPMTRIIARDNLTYLYTQVVRGRDRIFYGLDGTTGIRHSPLLSSDTVRESEVEGVQRLMTEGVTYVTEIEPWPPWGLIKSSFAPIFNDDGRPVAMAGADIDAGTIEFQVRRALVITLAIGTVLLILGGTLALAIARRLIEPINAIKAAALGAAAGDYTRRADVARPRELRHLSERVTATLARLGREANELRDTLFVRQVARDRAGLVERLERLPPLAPTAAPGARWAWDNLGGRRAGELGPGGAVQAGDHALVWISNPSGDPLTSAARRAEIGLTAEALLARHRSDLSALGPVLENLFPLEIAVWALLGPDGVHACLRTPGILFRRAADGRRLEIASAEFAAALRPGPDEALILASPGAPLNALPLAVPAQSAAGLLAAWRAAVPGNSPPAFAVILLPAFP